MSAIPPDCCKGVLGAEEVLCRLSEENQQLREAVKARSSPDAVNYCGQGPMRQPQSLAGVCTLLDSVIRRAAASGQ